jgi:hypothetical protein
VTGRSRPDPADRLALAHEHLVRAVETLTGGEEWRRMLAMAARLPTYSANNVLLIGIQRPDASRVAGIRTWNSLGRTVRKGEKGIAILAPCLHRPRAATADHTAPTGANRRPPQRDSDFVRRDRPGPGRGQDWHAGTGPHTERPDRPEIETARRELRGFRVVHVFDVAQTEGGPLPDVGPAELTGPAPTDLAARLSTAIAADGFLVERGDCGPAYGWTDFATRTVTSPTPRPRRPSPTSSRTSAPTTTNASSASTPPRSAAARRPRSKPNRSATSSPQPPA